MAALLTGGCSWDNVLIGGEVKLGGIITYIADVHVKGGVFLSNRKVGNEEISYCDGSPWGFL